MKQFHIFRYRIHGELLAWCSNKEDDRHYTPLGHAISSGNTKEVRRILEKYKVWKSYVDNGIDVSPFDDPSKYFSRVCKDSDLDIFQEFLELDLEPTEEMADSIVIHSYGSNRCTKFFALMNYRDGLLKSQLSLEKKKI